jgi:hypothetical protein
MAARDRNGLAVAYLRRRITLADEQIFLAALSKLAIHIDQPDVFKRDQDRSCDGSVLRFDRLGCCIR